MEKLRSLVRGYIGYNFLPYRIGSAILTLSYALFKGGFSGLRIAFLSSKRRLGQPGQWVVLRGILHPICIRPGTEDIGSILNNIFREEYGQFPNSFDPSTIVDAGAYIGDTSAYFLSRFKSARVFALEPNPESYDIAKKNLSFYGDRVLLMSVALSKQDGAVRISGSATGAAVSDSGYEVRSACMDTLMHDFQISKIDLLKMDIEGSELEVLRLNESDWLRKVRLLLLETHGQEIEKAVLPVIESYGFSISRFRNVWYCQNMAG